MTLKVRLAAMMTFLVVAVLALQFVLNAREQRDLAEEIARLSSEVSSSAHDVSLGALLASRGGRAPLQEFLRAIEEGDDSLWTAVRFVHHEALGALHPRVPREGPWIEREDSAVVKVIVVEGDIALDSLHAAMGGAAAGGPHGVRVLRYREPQSGASTEVRLESAPGKTRVTERSWVTGGAPVAFRSTRDFALRFPLPLADEDSLHIVEVSYPLESVTRALAASRRRGILWMSSLLGIGVLGAALMAVQFTRPLRTLERSFRKVESGDLSVSVQPDRNDEIGRLTTSFNHMVGRLRETKALETRLQESEHLAALGRLAAGVAHEVRNPLNAINLNLQQMRDKIERDVDPSAREGFERYHATVTRELGRLEGVVSAFLDLSRSERLDPEPMDLVESLTASVALFRPEAARRGVDLSLDTPAALAITGDPGRLATVWNNLVSNALSATATGGHVTVTATAEDDSVLVSVRDDGAGVGPESIGRIWEPFYSGRAGGTGLGLSIVRSVVERHGGRIDVESAPGAGTTIRVRLPAAPVA